ncbi:glyoxylate bypass operon transcriptional repressor IclR [Aquitalea aquatica]|uniref:Glyoxylate bypass operon transcriptional repressor IclR n=1 Tax=Aquitalea aquatica TaxID=3044273 RepID=A0A838XX44_9NEIS|nr:glyoxylate bypass operon transcriptional repressor IclR [Aquitalea magnusonii]MBA4707153.1 glyoxylate bypass operon transcriptional repressor IclR [Aquitalea magnusonii]
MAKADSPPRTPTRKRAENGSASTGQVQSLTRGLVLLERIAEAPAGIMLTDLSMQVGLPNSTTHRLLSTMQQMGFVQQTGDLGLWSIGVRAFTVGSGFLGSRDLSTLAMPVLRRTMEAAGETSNLVVFDTDAWQSVVVGQVQCRELMRMLAPIGGRLPLHASAAGKAFLAAQDAEHLNRILQKTGLPHYTEHTITTPTQLKEQLLRIQQQGFAFDDGEHALGLRCVASCIYDESGQAFAAISVSGPKSRIPDERITHLGSLIMQAASEITHRYGGKPRKSS